VRWSSAVSDAPSFDAALGAVVERATSQLGAPVDLAVFFVSHHFKGRYADAGKRLAARLPPGTLLGCSAGGVIGGGREVEERPGLALTVAHLPGVARTTFALEAEALPDADAPPSAWHAALGVPPEPVPQFILLGDPFSFPAEHFLAGLDYAYPRSTKIGGLASGARAAAENALYVDGEVHRSGVAGVALGGDVRIETVVAQGCRPVGAPLQITRCQGNIVFELDGRPVLAVLQDLVDELDEGDRRLLSQALFLGIVMDELVPEPRAGDFLVRNVLGIDPQQGALAVGERLRRGQTVQFHLRDARTSAADLATLLDRFAETAALGTTGALLFSCLGRGLHLYGRPDHDTDLVREHLGEVPLGGFFCNGEIGPVGGATRLHGYTSAFGFFGPASGS
jgi:small ligand-binding sensory domain FIST